MVGLMRMIDSIVENADDPNRIEFCIRLHDDDWPTLKKIDFILGAAPHVRILIGPTLRGYADLLTFTDDLYRIATGEWVWQMNDDVVIEGKGWDTKLANMDMGQIVMPEIHRLNDSIYKRDMRNCFHILPRNMVFAWCGKLPFPPDLGVIDVLREHLVGTAFLQGITAWHQRNVSREEELKREQDQSCTA